MDPYELMLIFIAISLVMFIALCHMIVILDQDLNDITDELAEMEEKVKTHDGSKEVNTNGCES